MSQEVGRSEPTAIVDLSAAKGARRGGGKRVLAVAAGFLLAPMLGSGDLFMVGAFLSILLLLMGFVYGPLGAWLPGLFPARVRYTGASVAFNVGGVIGGGFTPVAAQMLAEQGGLSFVGFYLSVAAALSLGALVLLRKPALD